MFLDMRRVRDRIYRLLNRRLWPREQSNLYFMLGCLNGLMGVTAERLVSAHNAREHEYSDDLLDIGGEFAISLATHHAFAGAALAEIEGGEPQAAEELERAISLYNAGPGRREEHWFGGKPLAGIDLAIIRLRSGALDAAVSALEPVLTLLPAQRITTLVTRLTLVRTELAAPVFRGSTQARAPTSGSRSSDVNQLPEACIVFRDLADRSAWMGVAVSR